MGLSEWFRKRRPASWTLIPPDIREPGKRPTQGAQAPREKCEPFHGAHDGIEVHPKELTRLVLIPEGKFWAGDYRAELGGIEFRPRLPDYYLAIHPVTNEQYVRFLNDVHPGSTDLEEWIDIPPLTAFTVANPIWRRGTGEYYASKGKSEPVGRVSWYGAQAYCAWAGLRLPTELEWEKGIRGTDRRNYPWGSNFDHALQRRLNELDDQNKTSGGKWEFPVKNSPFGLSVYNISEWCGDWFVHDAYTRYSTGDLSTAKHGTERVTRGFYSPISPRHRLPHEFACAYRDGSEPTRRNDYIGFRCARDAKVMGRAV